MLPFLRKNNDNAASGLIVKTRNPDEKPENQEDDSAAPIDSCSMALINAIHAKDHKGVSQAIKDAFDILESMPHDEYDSKHDYDSQNAKAGEEQD